MPNYRRGELVVLELGGGCKLVGEIVRHEGDEHYLVRGFPSGRIEEYRNWQAGCMRAATLADIKEADLNGRIKHERKG
jgi:hypothetical protein